MTSSKILRILGSILLFLLILLVILLAYFLFITASRAMNTVNSVLNPIQETNKALGTQVANLLHPTPTILPDPVTIIDKVRAVARLETIHYSVEKVITAEVNQGLFGSLLGDKLLFVAHGSVIAGVDLGKMSPEDMWLEEGILHVHLPAAEVLVATLDNQKSYVYTRDTGILTHGDPGLETAARREAETLIRQAALDDGILDQAQINASLFLENFFRNLGYKAVIFEEPKR